MSKSIKERAHMKVYVFGMMTYVHDVNVVDNYLFY